MKKLLGLVLVIVPTIFIITGLDIYIDWNLLLECTIDLLKFSVPLVSVGVGVYLLIS